MTKYTVVGYYDDAQSPFAELVESNTPNGAVRAAVRALWSEAADEETGGLDGLLDFAGGLTIVDVLEGHTRCLAITQNLCNADYFFEDAQGGGEAEVFEEPTEEDEAMSLAYDPNRPLVVEPSADGMSWIVKHLPGQVLADVYCGQLASIIADAPESDERRVKTGAFEYLGDQYDALKEAVERLLDLEQGHRSTPELWKNALQGVRDAIADYNGE